jgi:hypothetical protein
MASASGQAAAVWRLRVGPAEARAARVVRTAMVKRILAVGLRGVVMKVVVELVRKS